MKLFYSCLFLFFSYGVDSQEYNYTHYGSRDGLAGTTVYRMCQDKQGYLWFATDNGVSRFDGKTFKNFTTADGLPDNEVLFIQCDSKGRVWMMPFNKKICYYYEGKIYNANNHIPLKNVQFPSYAIMGGQNNKGDVYFLTTEGVYMYTESDEFKNIADFRKMADQYSLNPSKFNPALLPGRYPFSMVLYNSKNVFYEKDGEFKFLQKVRSDPEIFNTFYKIGPDLEMIFYKRLPPEKFTSRTFISNDLALYNTMNGSWLLDSNGMINDKHFLPGRKISHSLKDNEGNLWFSTLGEGVYRLTSDAVRTYFPGQEFFSIQEQGGKIYAGMDNGRLQVIQGGKIVSTSVFNKDHKSDITPRLYAMKSDGSGNIYLGFDSYLIKYNDNGRLISPLQPIKSIDIIDANHIMVCTNQLTLRLSSADLSVADTIWKERGTKVVYSSGFYFIGTLDGLIVKGADSGKLNKPVKLLTGKRIVDICRLEDGSIWIASNDNGIFRFRNGVIDALITTMDGLSSNNCRSLFAKGNFLWVGTNKGITKVNLGSGKVVRRYSTAHGLSSDIINAVYTEKDSIWICTPVGLTTFSESNVTDSSICYLDMSEVLVSGDKVKALPNLELTYWNNNISFNYTAVSFKSAGEIIYNYKMEGLDEGWQETDLTSISYPTLPPGEYKFQLYAINKFGKRSQTFSMKFNIVAPFWRTAWFWTAVSISSFLLLWYLLSRRYKALQGSQNEKMRLMTRMADLEQLTLRAQLNPHFFFNCLTSIQSFVLNNEMTAANHYIGEFGHLMRQTLDNSSSPSISITREIEYLESYIKLEQMRFSSKFRYFINVDPVIQADHTFIPSLLLQPFVENAIRHGLRHKKDPNAFIRINFRQTDQNLVIEVEDNGVGRRKAGQYKSIQPIEYQSKGMALTLERLNIMASKGNRKATVQVIDLEDENGKPSGTKIIIDFPLSLIEKLN
ncbi:MAG TPA: histidine kinase [Chitinophagaceae bacterium]|nr:histidine kinase [Chitinophagaceae bacterium]